MTEQLESDFLKMIKQELHHEKDYNYFEPMTNILAKECVKIAVNYSLELREEKETLKQMNFEQLDKILKSSNEIYDLKSKLEIAEKAFENKSFIITGNVEPIITEPAIIQSAFKFPNGRRVIIYTGGGNITSFECDNNWKPSSKAFAESPLNYSGKTATEYHLHLRNTLHKPEDFSPLYSTILTQLTFNTITDEK